MCQPLSHQDVADLPAKDLAAYYDYALAEYNALLDEIQADRSKVALLEKDLQTARLNYVLIRCRKFPKHFKMVSTADLLPTK